jgi:hypothetical protein
VSYFLRNPISHYRLNNSSPSVRPVQRDIFYSDLLLPCPSTLKLKDHPFSAVCDIQHILIYPPHLMAFSFTSVLRKECRCYWFHIKTDTSECNLLMWKSRCRVSEVKIVGRLIVRYYVRLKAKAVKLHATKALGGTGCIAPTYS